MVPLCRPPLSLSFVEPLFVASLPHPSDSSRRSLTKADGCSFHSLPPGSLRPVRLGEGSGVRAMERVQGEGGISSPKSDKGFKSAFRSPVSELRAVRQGRQGGVRVLRLQSARVWEYI